MFVQLTDFNGFAVVDFETHKETQRIALPKLAPDKKTGARGRQHVARHGGDGRRQALDREQPSQQRRLHLLAARPEARRLVDVGVAPDWVTLNGTTAYVANAGSNNVSVVDMSALREVTRIPVGQVPKRNITAMLP